MRNAVSCRFALLLALGACTVAPPRAPEKNLLDRAIVVAGGAAALQRARTLHWTGEAVVFAGERRIELGVDTTVRPFEQAHSTTWLRDKPDTTRRQMVMERTTGWIVRDGKREPMTQATFDNERLQFATYGLMRLVDLRQSDVRLTRLPDRAGYMVLHVEHPAAAPADLLFDAAGRLAALEDRVPDPSGDAELTQRFDFEGFIEDDGVRWPRILRITQSGHPFFELRLLTLDVGP